ncbi:hypothetical protein [Endozoicomonas sp. SCSIO W0465]|uniref:hypothetical protein n=1 Tax=Endozoicomonas sp. SCSIO W0465 TaxID=2918516 RepID=UPI00207634CF|nr:hypothetical protein [Endozoicomonas sp. SCSIO W0465]USE34162.1 hypothetical protein MJO57_18565 [Endozoicomonas sp. SCSIO W0465]
MITGATGFKCDGQSSGTHHSPEIPIMNVSNSSAFVFPNDRWRTSPTDYEALQFEQTSTKEADAVAKSGENRLKSSKRPATESSEGNSEPIFAHRKAAKKEPTSTAAIGRNSPEEVCLSDLHIRVVFTASLPDITFMPPELHVHISKFLDSKSLMALRLSHRVFQKNILITTDPTS